MGADKRRVLTLNGRGEISLFDEPIPPVAPGTVLVEVKSSLVSPGTELGGVPSLREKPTDAPPRPFGYGNAGVVLAVGEGVTDIAPDARVACMGAGYALHATHVVVPMNLTVPIPDGLSFDEAAFAHLAATGLHAVRRGEVQFGQNVVVMGLGLVGQLTAQFARSCGAHVMGVDRLPLRLRLASACGIDETANASSEDAVARAARFTGGRGMEVGVIAFGGDATAAVQDILKMLATSPDGHKMGVIVVVGGARFEAAWPVPFGNVDVRASSRPGPGYHDDAWERGKDYPPVFVKWTTRRNLEESLRAAAERRVAFSPLITHRVPLDDAPAACEEIIVNPGAALGVILNP
jgi:NADPH:quinone reductase